MATCAQLLFPILVVFLALFLGLGHESQYVFQPETMLRVSQAAIKRHQEANSTLQDMVDDVVAQLREEYPLYITKEPEWVFNNAGGAMGSMLILHASLTEYVIIFGTAVGTEGHTGRFLSDDYFTILHGEQWAFSAGSLEKEVFTPGTQHLMARGEAKQYRMPDSCWALEYARGNIVSMLPFGFADTFFSTLDLLTLWNTVRLSASGMFRNLCIGKV